MVADYLLHITSVSQGIGDVEDCLFFWDWKPERATDPKQMFAFDLMFNV